MSIEIKKVDLQRVANQAAPVSAPLAQKSPENRGENADAVKVTLAAANQSSEQAKATREQLRVEEEERERRFKEQADRNFARKSVQFLSSEEKAPVDLKFKVVESESGRVVVEYPADVAIKKMEQAQTMEEQEAPGQVINKSA